MIEKLGKYEIRRELGRGAMGVVYEAFDPVIKRTVAIKTIRAEQLGSEEASEVLARFRREAQAAGRLNHPNIVGIYDFDEQDGTSFIVMEYVAGRDLREIFAEDQRFAIPDVARLMGQVLAALDYSHRQKVVHRDIKPANIFLTADGTAKVADFGIAHIETSSLTHAGSVIGTPGYMSPEQIQGLPVDGRSDLFSAGVILYQLLTGERPFTGSAATTTMQKVLNEEPLPPSTLNVQLPDAIDAVMKKALAKKADQRYQTAAEFAQDLQRAMGPRGAVSPALPAGGFATRTVAAGASDATVIHGEDATALGSTVHARASSPPPQAAEVPPAPAYMASTPSQAPAKTIVLVVLMAVVASAVGMFLFKKDAGVPAGGLLTSATPPAATTASPAPAPAATPAPPAAPSTPASVAASAPPSSQAAPAPAQAPSAPAPQAAVSVPATTKPAAPPGTLVITAVGLADPSDPRYQGDAGKAGDEARADAKSQLVSKAIALLVDHDSLAKNYDTLATRLLANSGSYVSTVMRESEARVGQDGLVAVTTEALVNVKAVQKSLNEMTRKDRVQLIRASGDPRIALRVQVHDADRPDAPVRGAPVVENLLKERIKSFGFRTWSDDADPARAADFLVSVDAKLRAISTRLEASGITITKYAVSAMTVKCIDRASGEEIYFNTALPKGGGTFATSDEALRAFGERIADAFTRDFFLSHVNVAAMPVRLALDAVPERVSKALGRELLSLPAVLTAVPATSGNAWDLELAGSGSVSELVSRGVLAPLNAKMRSPCFVLGATQGAQVGLRFEERCNDEALVSRLETLPPAGLVDAPMARRSAVIKNPDTLKKLAI